MEKSLAKITFGEHFIGLLPDGTWQASSDLVAPMARCANVLSKPPYYEYSPSHGAYGPLLAHQVSNKLGGKPVLRKTPQGQQQPPDNIIF